MNKTAIILGSVVLLGAVGFFYFKNKSKTLTAVGLTEAGTTEGTEQTSTIESALLTPKEVEVIQNNIASGNSTTSTGITLTTPEQVVQVVNITNQQNQLNNEVQSLVTQISSLKNQLASLVNPTPFNFGNSLFFNYTTQKNMLNGKIQGLLNKLKALGYKLVDGKAVKIV